LQNGKTGELLSSWHDLEMESQCDEENTITGVIEITKGTNKKLEVDKHS
jgi:inorganic pyrophosphatase